MFTARTASPRPGRGIKGEGRPRQRPLKSLCGACARPSSAASRHLLPGRGEGVSLRAFPGPAGFSSTRSVLPNPFRFPQTAPFSPALCRGLVEVKAGHRAASGRPRNKSGESGVLCSRHAPPLPARGEESKVRGGRGSGHSRLFAALTRAPHPAFGHLLPGRGEGVNLRAFPVPAPLSRHASPHVGKTASSPYRPLDTGRAPG